jgi:acetylornithine deacetylase/succinyl-diaminopimelate desuccinylase-like protein
MEKNTAAEKLSFILSKIYEYRASQMKILEKDPLNFGDSISMNATIINGGLQINVVPAEFSVSIDIRLGTNVDHVEFEKMIRNWCEEAGGDIDIIFDMKDPYVEPTDIGETNLYWDRMKNAIEEM